MAATYTPIASVTLGTAASSVTFSSIPQTYTDLVLVSIPLTNGTAFTSNLIINNDTATNYSCTRMYGSGTAAGSDRFSSTASSLGSWGVGNSTSVPIIFVTDFLNYSNTTTYKTFLTKPNEPKNSTGSNYVGLIASLWRNTAAITSIEFKTSANFASGSTFNLYGILGANA